MEVAADSEGPSTQTDGARHPHLQFSASSTHPSTKLLLPCGNHEHDRQYDWSGDLRGYTDFEALLRGEFDTRPEQAALAQLVKPAVEWDHKTGHRLRQRPPSWGPSLSAASTASGGSASSTANLQASAATLPASTTTDWHCWGGNGTPCSPPQSPQRPAPSPRCQRWAAGAAAAGQFGSPQKSKPSQAIGVPQPRSPLRPDQTPHCLQCQASIAGPFAAQVPCHCAYHSNSLVHPRPGVDPGTYDPLWKARQQPQPPARAREWQEQKEEEEQGPSAEQEAVHQILERCAKVIADMEEQDGAEEEEELLRNMSLEELVQHHMLERGGARAKDDDGPSKARRRLQKEVSKFTQSNSVKEKDLERLWRRMHVVAKRTGLLLSNVTGGQADEKLTKLFEKQLQHVSSAAHASLGLWKFGNFKKFGAFLDKLEMAKEDRERKSAPSGSDSEAEEAENTATAPVLSAKSHGLAQEALKDLQLVEEIEEVKEKQRDLQRLLRANTFYSGDAELRTPSSAGRPSSTRQGGNPRRSKMIAGSDREKFHRLMKFIDSGQEAMSKSQANINVSKDHESKAWGKLTEQVTKECCGEIERLLAQDDVATEDLLAIWESSLGRKSVLPERAMLNFKLHQLREVKSSLLRQVSLLASKSDDNAPAREPHFVSLSAWDSAFCIHLNVERGERLGVQVEVGKDNLFTVTAIKSDGIFAAWNAEHPVWQVCEGDKVASEDPFLLAALLGDSSKLSGEARFKMRQVPVPAHGINVMVLRSAPMRQYRSASDPRLTVASIQVLRRSNGKLSLRGSRRMSAPENLIGLLVPNVRVNPPGTVDVSGQQQDVTTPGLVHRLCEDTDEMCNIVAEKLDDAPQVSANMGRGMSLIDQMEELWQKILLDLLRDPSAIKSTSTNSIRERIISLLELLGLRQLFPDRRTPRGLVPGGARRASFLPLVFEEREEHSGTASPISDVPQEEEADAADTVARETKKVETENKAMKKRIARLRLELAKVDAQARVHHSKKSSALARERTEGAASAGGQGADDLVMSSPELSEDLEELSEHEVSSMARLREVSAESFGSAVGSQAPRVRPKLHRQGATSMLACYPEVGAVVKTTRHVSNADDEDPQKNYSLPPWSKGVVVDVLDRSGGSVAIEFHDHGVRSILREHMRHVMEVSPLPGDEMSSRAPSTAASAAEAGTNSSRISSRNRARSGEVGGEEEIEAEARRRWSTLSYVSVLSDLLDIPDVHEAYEEFGWPMPCVDRTESEKEEVLCDAQAALAAVQEKLKKQKEKRTAPPIPFVLQENSLFPFFPQRDPQHHSKTREGSKGTPASHHGLLQFPRFSFETGDGLASKRGSRQVPHLKPRQPLAPLCSDRSDMALANELGVSEEMLRKLAAQLDARSVPGVRHDVAAYQKLLTTNRAREMIEGIGGNSEWMKVTGITAATFLDASKDKQLPAGLQGFKNEAPKEQKKAPNYLQLLAKYRLRWKKKREEEAGEKKGQEEMEKYLARQSWGKMAEKSADQADTSQSGHASAETGEAIATLATMAGRFHKVKKLAKKFRLANAGSRNDGREDVEETAGTPVGTKPQPPLQKSSSWSDSSPSSVQLSAAPSLFPHCEPTEMDLKTFIEHFRQKLKKSPTQEGEAHGAKASEGDPPELGGQGDSKQQQAKEGELGIGLSPTRGALEEHHKGQLRAGRRWALDPQERPVVGIGGELTVAGEGSHGKSRAVQVPRPKLAGWVFSQLKTKGLDDGLLEQVGVPLQRPSSAPAVRGRSSLEADDQLCYGGITGSACGRRREPLASAARGGQPKKLKAKTLAEDLGSLLQCTHVNIPPRNTGPSVRSLFQDSLSNQLVFRTKSQQPGSLEPSIVPYGDQRRVPSRRTEDARAYAIPSWQRKNYFPRRKQLSVRGQLAERMIVFTQHMRAWSADHCAKLVSPPRRVSALQIVGHTVLSRPPSLWLPLKPRKGRNRSKQGDGSVALDVAAQDRQRLRPYRYPRATLRETRPSKELLTQPAGGDGLVVANSRRRCARILLEASAPTSPCAATPQEELVAGSHASSPSASPLKLPLGWTCPRDNQEPIEEAPAKDEEEALEELPVFRPSRWAPPAESLAEGSELGGRLSPSPAETASKEKEPATLQETAMDQALLTEAGHSTSPSRRCSLEKWHALPKSPQPEASRRQLDGQATAKPLQEASQQLSPIKLPPHPLLPESLAGLPVEEVQKSLQSSLMLFHRSHLSPKASSDPWQLPPVKGIPRSPAATSSQPVTSSPPRAEAYNREKRSALATEGLLPVLADAESPRPNRGWKGSQSAREERQLPRNGGSIPGHHRVNWVAEPSSQLLASIGNAAAMNRYLENFDDALLEEFLAQGPLNAKDGQKKSATGTKEALPKLAMSAKVAEPERAMSREAELEAVKWKSRLTGIHMNTQRGGELKLVGWQQHGRLRREPQTAR